MPAAKLRWASLRSMNLNHIRVLARYELRYAVGSARGVLFLALYGILWFWLLWKLSDGRAAWLAQPEGNVLASWLLDPSVARYLFLDHPPTLSAFFLIALTVIPIFTLWGAGDQTATDIGTRHLRFLIPRCGRLEIYVGRFVGAALFISGVHLLLAAVAAVVTLIADNTGIAATLAYGVRVLLAMWFYAMPYVALMSMFGAMTGSAPVAVLTAMTTYVVIGVIAGLLSNNWEAAVWLGYLMPAPLKPAFLTGEIFAYLSAACGALVYTAIYFFAGWQIFRRRDI